MPRLTLRDGSEIELPEGEPVGGVLPKGTVARGRRRRAPGPLVRPEWRRRGAPVDASSDEGLDVLRHSTAHVLAQGRVRRVPRNEVRDRPADRRRLLLRLRAPRADRAGGPVEDRPTDAPDRSRRRSPSSARRSRGARPVERLADQPFKIEIIDDDRRRRGRGGGGDDGPLYRNGRLGRPLHGSARAVDRQARRLQADEARRRLLAGRREHGRC